VPKSEATLFVFMSLIHHDWFVQFSEHFKCIFFWACELFYFCQLCNKEVFYLYASIIHVYTIHIQVNVTISNNWMLQKRHWNKNWWKINGKATGSRPEGVKDDVSTKPLNLKIWTHVTLTSGVLTSKLTVSHPWTTCADLHQNITHKSLVTDEWTDKRTANLRT